MSVAVPVVATVDGEARKVYLKSGVRSYHPVDDIAAELQQLRNDIEAHRQYYPLIIEQGGVFKGGASYTGKYALFIDGAEVIPADDAAHDLSITGEQIDGLGKVGIDLVDKTSLIHSVNINYIPPPTTEIRAVNTGSGVSAQDKVDIADANWSHASAAALLADVALIKDIEGGAWKITGNQMIFYKADNITEAMRFDLKNKAGDATEVDVFERLRV